MPFGSELLDLGVTRPACCRWPGGRICRSDPLVERSTTATDSVDVVETGWTEPHIGRPKQTSKTKPSPCQGEGRGFESRLPLHRSGSEVVFNPLERRPKGGSHSKPFGTGTLRCCVLGYVAVARQTRFGDLRILDSRRRRLIASTTLPGTH
jgi:hypothetical protein